MKDALANRLADDFCLSSHLYRIPVLLESSTVYECMSALHAAKGRMFLVGARRDIPFSGGSVLIDDARKQIDSQFRIITMSDILASFLNENISAIRDDMNSIGCTYNEHDGQPSCSSPSAFQAALDKLFSSPISSISCRHYPYTAVFPADTLSAVISGFKDSSRVILFDIVDGMVRPSYYVTSIDVFQYFCDNDFFTGDTFAARFVEIADSLMIDECMSRNELVYLAVDNNFLTALELFSEKYFTALPIYDSELHQMASVISIQDITTIFLNIRNLGECGHHIVKSDVMMCISLVRQHFDIAKARFPMITASLTSPLSSVVNKMLTSRIQRLYITDQDSNVIGSFSRTDLNAVLYRMVTEIESHPIYEKV